MVNQQIAQIFYRMAELLEMQDVKFKPRAYEKVARILDSMNQDVTEIYQQSGLKALEEIPGVGKSIAEKIEEFIKTGKIKAYEDLKKKCPVKLEELSAIEGLGPKMIKVLYDKLKIKNLKDLEKAAKAGKIRQLEHFGQKTEENILKGIEFAKKGKGRFLLGYILPLVRKIESQLKELKEVNKVSIAGSVRRMKETIGDLDFLVTSSDPEKVMDFFVSMPEVERVYAKGPTKLAVRLKNGIDADMRVVAEESFGSALQYFTGNKDHNIKTRRLAQEKGLKLNEYGIFSVRGKKEKYIVGRTEKEIYQTIGLPYIEPELRENTGEIEAGLRQVQGKPNGLPKIIGYDEIKGDLQMHTDWSDGSYSIEQMAKAAAEIGYEYIAITDHTGELKIAGAMDEKTLLRQMKEIDKINLKLKKQGYIIRILKGAEVNIKEDGTLDIKDEILAKLDIVLASIHSHLRMSKKEMTERICRAMRNPHVDIIAHPTGRIIQARAAYEIDMDEILKVAKQTKTALEINAFPERLDLNDLNIRKAVERGVKLVISTDAHNKDQLRYMELGIAQARRGWAEKKDILNTKSVDSFLKALK